MEGKRTKDISIVVTFFYMKFVGFWVTKSDKEERLRRFALSYTFYSLMVAVFIETRDLYYTWGDFGEFMYTVCNAFTILMVLLKLFVSILHRKKLQNLVRYAIRNFWHSNYDPAEQAILDNCYRICTYLICVFSFFAQGTVAGYIARPIIANIGRNESERILPFNMWVDLPLSMTPYFEVMFIIQVLMLCHIGVCYLCFDNFLCIMNMHAASQFRILQYKLTTIYPVNDSERNHAVEKYYSVFKDYVKMHQTLIVYCNRLEEVFSVMVLAQVLLFSLLICLDGYLILLEFIYTVCNALTVAMVLVKLFISVLHRRKLLNLVKYATRNFWHSNYDPAEQAILDNCYRVCTYLICVFSFFAQGTVAGYIIRPIVANIGRNESERILPFNMWVNLPLSMTPYFEVMFSIQVFALYHIGVCYLCFDNFLCIMNMHAASQFRMLHYKLTTMCPMNHSEQNYGAEKHYAVFKDYVRKHQTLIVYCNRLDEVFSVMVLVQVFLFSLLICLDGYLILMEDAPRMRRVTFLFHVIGCICQLLMFTYSCDCLIRESTNVANAAYESPWTTLPVDKSGRMVRNDLLLVILRSRTPCCLTACGFFIVSLETYTKVLSTAVSYFTLLSQY